MSAQALLVTSVCIVSSVLSRALPAQDVDLDLSLTHSRLSESEQTHFYSDHSKVSQSDIAVGYTVGYTLADPFVLGKSRYFIGTLFRCGTRYIEINTGDKDEATEEPIWIHDSKTESCVGERILATDLRTLSTVQLRLTGFDAHDYDLMGSFALSSDQAGIIVRRITKPGDRIGSEDETLWAWNPATGEIQRIDEPPHKLWRLVRAIDSEACHVDESELEQGYVTLHSRKTGKTARVEISRVPSGGSSLHESMVTGAGDFCLPSARPSSVIVGRSDVCRVECIDANAMGGMTWVLSKENIETAIGSAPLCISAIQGCQRPCRDIHLLVRESGVGKEFYIRVSTSSGKIEEVHAIDFDCFSCPVISPNGRWVAFVRREIIKRREVSADLIEFMTLRPETLSVINLEKPGTIIDVLPAYEIKPPAARLTVVAVRDDGSMIVKSGDAVWEVRNHRGWERRKLFELPRRNLMLAE